MIYQQPDIEFYLFIWDLTASLPLNNRTENLSTESASEIQFASLSTVLESYLLSGSIEPPLDCLLVRFSVSGNLETKIKGKSMTR